MAAVGETVKPKQEKEKETEKKEKKLIGRPLTEVDRVSRELSRSTVVGDAIAESASLIEATMDKLETAEEAYQFASTLETFARVRANAYRQLIFDNIGVDEGNCGCGCGCDAVKGGDGEGNRNVEALKQAQQI